MKYMKKIQLKYNFYNELKYKNNNYFIIIII